MDTSGRGTGSGPMAEHTVREAHGASQIGPFDSCPRLGFREYWHPAVEARQVHRKPVHLTMLGDDPVLFRDKADRVVALSDWCPHRGAQKLGPLDVGLIHFRRHLAQRARDDQRLGAARGALKGEGAPPARESRMAGGERA